MALSDMCSPSNIVAAPGLDEVLRKNVGVSGSCWWVLEVLAEVDLDVEAVTRKVDANPLPP